MNFSDELNVLTDDELQKREAENLRVIRDGLAIHGFKPTKAGLVPEGLEVPPAFMGSLSTMERRAHEVEQIRKLLPVRQKERVAVAEQEKAQDRAHLEQVLAHAPADAARVEVAAREALPAVERMRSFIRDLNTLAAASGYEGQWSKIVADAQTAARALGEPEPSLGSMPEGLPDREEVKATVALLSGRTDGFRSGRLDRGGNYNRVAETASRYHR